MAKPKAKPEVEQDNATVLTPQQRTDAFISLSSVLSNAHSIVEGAIEGRPLSANLLENYYTAWAHLQEETVDWSGCLIGEEMIDGVLAQLEGIKRGPK